MKKNLLAVVFIAQSFFSSAQKNSELGYFLPTEGTMRVLVVYAQIDYATCGGDPYETCQDCGNNDNWRDPDPNSSDPLLNCSNPLNCAPPYWETGGGPLSLPQQKLFNSPLAQV